MKTRIVHPIWTHAAALAFLGAAVVGFVWILPLPGQIPLHFDGSGRPNRWGSPWEIPLLVFPLLVGAIVVFAAIDEMWARQENRKRFNWFSLIDEAVVGALVGVLGQLFLVLHRGGDYHFIPSPVWTLVSGGVAVLLGVVLEWLRPYRPSGEGVGAISSGAEGSDRMDEAIADRIRSGERWAYWESQNPAYIGLLVLMVSVLLVAGIVVPLGQPFWVVALEVLALLVVVAAYGGLRVTVTAKRLDVRLGMVGIPLLRMPLAELEEAAVLDFAPLADFGGWGIRGNRQMKAFFFRGASGVRLRTRAGKQYLIGSDCPERLLAVIETVRRLSRGEEAVGH